ncbi:HlyD family secretion protein [Microvirga terrae]|uniref:HlyD family secretion protein n=1 Tax=Microvirga terrae TaxID=2740529 RepID=A0ABY5RP22_9HYPH|nr:MULTISPECIES: HlyD family secretion protein [Microvirga]UVF18993.1 HlyD family secretion protein [Microvirga terrae]
MTLSPKKKLVGVALCLGGIVAGGAIFLIGGGAVSTDNAYVRTDITSIAPRVGGYVREVAVSDNQSVAAGDILFRIDDEDYRAKVAQAEANVAAARARLTGAQAEIDLQQSMILQAEAQYLTATAELELAEKISARRLSLVRTNAVSTAQVDESESALSRAKAGLAGAEAATEAQRRRLALLEAQLQGAQAALRQAEASRDLARIDLDNTIVRAPVAGRIGNRQIRQGRLVAPGVSLLDIVPTQDVWVVANFKETQLPHVAPGMAARIKVDGLPDVPLNGRVESIAPGSGATFSLLPPDNATGNFVRVVQRVPVRIRFESHPMLDRVLPGLSARVTIDQGSSQ